MFRYLLSLIFVASLYAQAGSGQFPPANSGGVSSISLSNPLNSACTVNNSAYPLISYNGTPYSCQGSSGPLAGTYQTLPGTGGASSPATSGLLKGTGNANGIIPASPTVDYVAPDTYAVGTGGVTAGVLVTTDTSANNRVITPTTSACGFGVALSTQAAGTSVKVQTVGLAQIYADVAIPVGHIAVCSASVGGYITDSGFTSASSIAQTTHIIGAVTVASTGSSTLATVRLHGPGSYGAAPTVPSVAGRTGAIVLTVADVSGAQSASSPNTNNDAAGAAAAALSSANIAMNAAIAALNLGTASQHPATDFDAAGAAAAAQSAAVSAANAATAVAISALNLGSASQHATSDFDTAGSAAAALASANAAVPSLAPVRFVAGVSPSGGNVTLSSSNLSDGANLYSIGSTTTTTNPYNTTCIVPNGSVGSLPKTYTVPNPSVTYNCVGATPGGSGTYQAVTTSLPAQASGTVACNNSGSTASPVGCTPAQANAITDASTTARNFAAPVTAPSLGNIQSLDGLMALFPNPINSGSWSSAVAYSPCQVVVSSGVAYISVATSTNQTPAVNSPYWWPTKYTTGFTPTPEDCSFATVAEDVMVNKQTRYVQLGSKGSYNTFAGIQLPVPTDGTLATMNLIGAGRMWQAGAKPGTVINYTGTLAQPVISKAAAINGSFYPAVEIRNMEINGGGVATSCGDLLGITGQHVWDDIDCYGVANGSSFFVRLGDGSSTGGGYEAFGHSSKNYGNGKNGEQTLVTANISGGQITSYTITNAGGSYTGGAYTAINLYGYSNGLLPCTTMPDTPTLTFNGSGTLTAVTPGANLGAGCVGPVDVVINELQPVSYGFSIGVSDSSFYDYLDVKAGTLAAFNIIAGHNSFYHPHTTGGVNTGYYNAGGGNKFFGPVCDTVAHLCFDNEGTQTSINSIENYFNSSTNVAASRPGAIEFYQGTGSSSWITVNGDSSGRYTAGADFHQWANSSGILNLSQVLPSTHITIIGSTGDSTNSDYNVLASSTYLNQLTLLPQVLATSSANTVSGGVQNCASGWTGTAAQLVCGQFAFSISGTGAGAYHYYHFGFINPLNTTHDFFQLHSGSLQADLNLNTWAASGYIATPVTATFSATPTFSLSSGYTQTITLTANITSFAVTGIVTGMKDACINFVQGGSGGYTVAGAPAYVHGFMTIPGSEAVGKYNYQCWDSIDGTNLIAKTNGVTNQ